MSGSNPTGSEHFRKSRFIYRTYWEPGIGERQGSRADILMGHSFGELAAFEIAGCFDLLTGVTIVCERVRSIAQHAPSDGELLIVSENRSRVASEMSFVEPDQVVIAGRNHQQQTVLSGPRDQLSQVADFFRQLGISCCNAPGDHLLSSSEFARGRAGMVSAD